MAGIAKLVGKRDFEERYFALYFTASWCGPCRTFTPLLTELYQEFRNEKNCEIILISSDHDQRSFSDYYQTMPWLALPFRERRKAEELARRFNVNEIPKLVLIDGDSGTTLCTNAKEQILYLDVEGTHFPWRST